MLISLRKQAMTTPKIRAAIHASNVPAWMLERVGPDRILESERLRHALAERYGISEQTVWIGRQDEAARAACRYRSSWAYRSFWKFWQASAPATIRRLLRPRHPFTSIARVPLEILQRGVTIAARPDRCIDCRDPHRSGWVVRPPSPFDVVWATPNPFWSTSPFGKVLSLAR